MIDRQDHWPPDHWLPICRTIGPLKVDVWPPIILATQMSVNHTVDCTFVIKELLSNRYLMFTTYIIHLEMTETRFLATF